jgi:anti-sigma B factor antagonist
VLDLVATIEAAELPDGELVVSVHGPLDGRAAGELRDALLPVAGADGTLVVVDLEGAHGLDDVVLAVIGRAAQVVADRGGRLGIVTRSPFVARLVTDSGLDEVVSLHTTLKEAIR